MSATSKEVFLKGVVSELKNEYPQWPIEDHFKLQWIGQPSDTWPEADIVIDMPRRRVVINYDEDSDPVSSLTRYWPILHDQGHVSLTIIQIWQRGKATGDGYATLARWTGMRLMELYPGTIYEFIEKTSEPAEVVTKKITNLIIDREKLSED